MDTWAKKFWKDHGDRMLFMLLALLFSIGMYTLEWKEESKVIIIGLAMLCYNKARSPVEPAAPPETLPKPETLK